MKIKIGFVGYLDVTGIRNNSEISVAGGTSVAGVLGRCGISLQYQDYIEPYVNGAKQKLSYVLQEGDELYLFLPVGGGK